MDLTKENIQQIAEQDKKLSEAHIKVLADLEGLTLSEIDFVLHWAGKSFHLF